MSILNEWQKKRELAIAYKRTFNTPHGKQVLLDLMRQAHALGPTYVRGDSHHTAFQEGERNLVSFIFTRLNVDMEKLAQFAKGEEGNG